ncbi:MAG: hypothetical protein JSW55_02410 [Chloroflexota bacterium]|nr:MAG: hypothetical protein JSW55_02410 [Chloroflexota bacterium]
MQSSTFIWEFLIFVGRVDRHPSFVNLFDTFNMAVSMQDISFVLIL